MSATTSPAIRSFEVDVPEPDLDELRRRVLATRLPEQETVTDATQGVLFTKGIGYATEMNLRPQTLYGLADSPVALAGWMLDHDASSYEDIARAFVDGEPVGNLTRDEVLGNR